MFVRRQIVRMHQRFRRLPFIQQRMRSGSCFLLKGVFSLNEPAKPMNAKKRRMRGQVVCHYGTSNFLKCATIRLKCAIMDLNCLPMSLKRLLMRLKCLSIRLKYLSMSLNRSLMYLKCLLIELKRHPMRLSCLPMSHNRHCMDAIGHSMPWSCHVMEDRSFP